MTRGGAAAPTLDRIAELVATADHIVTLPGGGIFEALVDIISHVLDLHAAQGLVAPDRIEVFGRPSVVYRLITHRPQGTPEHLVICSYPIEPVILVEHRRDRSDAASAVIDNETLLVVITTNSPPLVTVKAIKEIP